MRKQAKRISHVDRVFGYHKEQNSSLSACTIFGGLSVVRSTASLPIYHVLEKFMGASLIRRIESLYNWATCWEGRFRETPLISTYDESGNTTKHDVSQLPRSIANLSKRTGFIPYHIVFEIHGRCSSCNTGVPAH